MRCKLELVAEGVESDWDAQFLAAAGYDYAQGFHYTRALPADKCFAWIIAFNGTAMLTPIRRCRACGTIPGRCPGEDTPVEAGKRHAPSAEIAAIYCGLRRGTHAKPA